MTFQESKIEHEGSIRCDGENENIEHDFPAKSNSKQDADRQKKMG